MREKHERILERGEKKRRKSTVYREKTRRSKRGNGIRGIWERKCLKQRSKR